MHLLRDKNDKNFVNGVPEAFVLKRGDWTPDDMKRHHKRIGDMYQGAYIVSSRELLSSTFRKRVYINSVNMPVTFEGIIAGETKRFKQDRGFFISMYRVFDIDDDNEDVLYHFESATTEAEAVADYRLNGSRKATIITGVGHAI